MDPARPSLVSFYCACGTPLSAVVGSGNVVCHACGATQSVPTVLPSPGDAGTPDPGARQRRNTRGVIALIIGAVGIAAKLAMPHTVVHRNDGGTYVSDGPMDTALLALAVIGAVLVLYGLVLLLTAPPKK